MVKRTVVNLLVVMAFLLSLAMPLQVQGAGQIDLNVATVAELQELSSVGPKTAERIVEYREKHGAFHSVDELVNVKGIGMKKLERIRSMVTVGEGD